MEIQLDLINVMVILYQSYTNNSTGCPKNKWWFGKVLSFDLGRGVFRGRKFPKLLELFSNPKNTPPKVKNSKPFQITIIFWTPCSCTGTKS